MFSNTYFVQTADIDLSAHYWDAIGVYTSSSEYQAFAGTYDGGNFTISGLYTKSGSSSTYDYQGLFGYVEGRSSSIRASIKNIGIIDSNVQGYEYVGGVVGHAWYSTITNCYNTGNITGNSEVGGVVGYAGYSTITNCYNTSAVLGSYRYVGGVVGYAGSSTITNCYNAGTVDVNYYVGGVVGVAYDSQITNCYNSGSVTGGGYYVGGVVGYTSRSDITNCYNTGSVTGGGNDVGGVVGYASGSTCILTNCYYGGNCTLSYGNGRGSNSGASKDENLIANAKSLSWYQNSSKWYSSYPWDFENVWTFVDGVNDGYPVLRGFSTKITYNSNSQPEEVVSESFSVGETIVLAEADLFVREGYSVSSWNTVADGSGVSYAPGATYTGSSITLYAQWEAMVITVNLDVNGGSGGTSAIYLKYDSGWYSSSSCTSSSKITALPSTPTRTGYEFKGAQSTIWALRNLLKMIWQVTAGCSRRCITARNM